MTIIIMIILILAKKYGNIDKKCQTHSPRYIILVLELWSSDDKMKLIWLVKNERKSEQLQLKDEKLRQ